MANCSTEIWLNTLLFFLWHWSSVGLFHVFMGNKLTAWGPTFKARFKSVNVFINWKKKSFAFRENCIFVTCILPKCLCVRWNFCLISVFLWVPPPHRFYRLVWANTQQVLLSTDEYYLTLYDHKWHFLFTPCHFYTFSYVHKNTFQSSGLLFNTVKLIHTCPVILLALIMRCMWH